jgi:hypothetical protein
MARHILTGLTMATLCVYEVLMLGMWAHDVFIGWMRPFAWMH